MRKSIAFISLLVLFLGGCSTTDDGGNAPKPARIQPAFNRMADRTYRIPVQTGQDTIEKANVMKTLVSDLGLVADGKLELSEVAEAFGRFAGRYEHALGQTVGYYERVGFTSGDRPNVDSNAYESSVKLWMAVSGGPYDRASFERWALSLLEGYRLDLQISDPATAGENLRQEVENYLW
jgi:hypothetical protein